LVLLDCRKKAHSARLNSSAIVIFVSALNLSSGTATLQSADGLWCAVVHPVGASLVSLSFENSEIVISPYDEAFVAFAGATLAPWPNRLEDGTWVFADKTLQHSINDESGHNANHGLVFDREFEVTALESDSISLSCKLGEDAVYPFQVSIEVTYLLTSAGLRETITAVNHDSQIVPVAFGAHPYFVFENDSFVAINAREIYSKSRRLLPIAKIPIAESGLAKSGFNRASELDLDDCFTDLIENQDLRYSALVTRPSIGKTVEIWQDKIFDHIMLFVYRETSGRCSIAIEPQTAPANAFRSNDGLHWIAPAQQLTASWGISLIEGLAND